MALPSSRRINAVDVLFIIAAWLAADLAQCRHVQSSSYQWPIIGVWTQPLSAKDRNEYIAGSYVKWLEASGAQVIPLPYSGSRKELDGLLKMVNGILIPGGDATLNDNIRYVFQRALALNDVGHYMPIWGTCMGFEFLLQCVGDDEHSKDTVLESGFAAWNISLPLDFTSAARRSRLFSKESEEQMSMLGSKNVTMNNHVQGIRLSSFNSHQRLYEFFDVLSTNTDRNGVEFVSAMEAKKYPVYGVQFHPEKNAYEWGWKDGAPFEAIEHDSETIDAMARLSSFFVAEARKSPTRPDMESTQKLSVHHYPVKGSLAPDFLEIFYFAHKKQEGPRSQMRGTAMNAIADQESVAETALPTKALAALLHPWYTTRLQSLVEIVTSAFTTKVPERTPLLTTE